MRGLILGILETFGGEPDSEPMWLFQIYFNLDKLTLLTNCEFLLVLRSRML